MAIHIPRHSTRACRAKNLLIWLINWRHHNIHKIKASSLTPDMNWVMSFLHISPNQFTRSQVSELNCNSSPHLITLVKDHWTTCQGVKINFTVQFLWSISVKIISLYMSPSSGLFFISPDEDLLFEVETSWAKLLSKFQYWWSELNWHC